MYPNVVAKVKGGIAVGVAAKRDGGNSHSAPAGFEPLSRLSAILHYPYAITYLAIDCFSSI